MKRVPRAPERGDIAWLDFGPRMGHEEPKRRPALVLSPFEYNARSGFALVCPISSRAKGYHLEVHLNEQMQTRGVVLSDRVRSCDWRTGRIEFCERAPEGIIDEVLARVAALFGL